MLKMIPFPYINKFVYPIQTRQNSVEPTVFQSAYHIATFGKRTRELQICTSTHTSFCQKMRASFRWKGRLEPVNSVKTKSREGFAKSFSTFQKQTPRGKVSPHSRGMVRVL
ncbi:unnamed protein product [Phytomonas sp. Hart1]|nr:unnamed protein product [Phytomonas sp. Hart1]|eukprot:CCW66679.1 unnamed protein product [Phytomonas sp. isolate Hart1]